MRDTFLFDLDGTVLPMDFNKFMELYFYNIGEFFKDVINPKDLVKHILMSTEVMVKTNNEESNEDIFMKYFDSLVEGNVEDYKPMFYEFYNSSFENVKASTHKSKYMRKSIDLLKEKGYKVVLATNPVFPMVANHHRIRWAGFEANEFEYISSFEGNHFCKPHLEYYNEVLESIDKKAENCYMVGNDVYDDLSAGKLGIETYLITNHMLNKHDQEVVVDHQGTYYDFFKFVQKLENIKIEE